MGEDVEAGAARTGEPGAARRYHIAVGGVVEDQGIEDRGAADSGHGHRPAGEVRAADRGRIEVDVAGKVLGDRIVRVTRLDHDGEGVAGPGADGHRCQCQVCGGYVEGVADAVNDSRTTDRDRVAVRRIVEDDTGQTGRAGDGRHRGGAAI